jgi:hypothetical protein
VSAILAAIIFFLGFIPQFLLLLLNIDNPLFSKALANLAIGGLGAFIICFIALVIILSISVIIVTVWRLYHPGKTKVVGGKLAEPKPSSSGPLPEVSPVRTLNTRSIIAIGGISGFIYFMYYIGRAYSDGYSAVLGVPSSLIHYEIQDYVYFGAQIETIWITLMFTAILIGFLVTWFRRYPIEDKPHARWATVGILAYLVLYGLALLLFAMYQIFRPDLVVEKAFVVTILTTCIFLFGAIIMVLYFDPDTFARIRIGKIKTKIFITVAIITLLIAPYMSGKAWGAFKGQIVNINDFPNVEIYTTRQIIDGINWVSVDSVTFRSASSLHLILKTAEYVVLKAGGDDNSVYVLKQSDILSIKIISLTKIK